jgi:murein DD-endopeptidase MepM/ murein hydrolase activator NlpD
VNEVEIKPCAGDPGPNPEIAPQTNSGIQGGMHDTCARKNKKSICKGIRGSKWHNGVDIKNPYGAPIYAIYDGNATKHEQRDEITGKLKGAGYYVAIESQVNGKEVRLVFFHLQEGNRITGNIQAGDIIGYQGDSGNLKSGIADGYTESHVHIKAQENGANVNPLNHFKTKIDLNTGQLINPCN